MAPRTIAVSTGFIWKPDKDTKDVHVLLSKAEGIYVDNFGDNHDRGLYTAYTLEQRNQEFGGFSACVLLKADIYHFLFRIDYADGQQVVRASELYPRTFLASGREVNFTRMDLGTRLRSRTRKFGEEGNYPTHEWDLLNGAMASRASNVPTGFIWKPDRDANNVQVLLSKAGGIYVDNFVDDLRYTAHILEQRNQELGSPFIACVSLEDDIYHFLFRVDYADGQQVFRTSDLYPTTILATGREVNYIEIL